MDKGVNVFVYVVCAVLLGIVIYLVVGSSSSSVLFAPNITKINASNVGSINATQINKTTICIPVRTPQDLDNVRNNLAGNYCQMNDIDLKGYSNWAPIGNPDTPFIGTYNGKNFKISNMRIRSDSGWIGLFGGLNNKGIIINTHLANGTIVCVANTISCNFLGLMVGMNDLYGGIVNSSTEGIIYGGSADYVGGIAGLNRGLIKDSSSVVTIYGENRLGGIAGAGSGQPPGGEDASTIINSKSSGQIYGDPSWGTGIGGIIGYGYWGKIISSSSNITLNGYDGVGGIAGEATAMYITDSYSYSNSIGSDGVGGLIGNLWSTDIWNSYATGKVEGNLRAGGLIGYMSSGRIYSSYWDINTSGQSISAGGEGKTTAQMKTQSTYSGWDFANTWKMPAGDYPRLKWESVGLAELDKFLHLKFNELPGSTFFADSSPFLTEARCNPDYGTCPSISNFERSRPDNVADRGNINFSSPSDIIIVPQPGTPDNLHMSPDMTISAWIYPRSLAVESGVIVAKMEGYIDCPASQPGCSDREYFLSINQSGRIQFQVTPVSRIGIGAVNCQTPAGVAPYNTWTHVVAQVSSSEQKMKIYVNGAQIASCTQPTLSSGIRTSSGALTIGRMTSISWGGWSLPFNGYIDDVRLYNRTLTQAEINLLMQE